MARAARGRGPRRKTEWGGFGDNAGAVALPIPISVTAGTPAIISNGIVVSGSTGLADNEVTIIRTIGVVTAAIQTNTAGLLASFAVGLGVFRGEAVAGGVTTLPSPEDDPDFEWLYYF